MPEFAELIVSKVTCSHCNRKTTVPGGVVKFQWGKIPSTYKPGDSIIWLRDDNQKIVPPFKIVKHKSLSGVKSAWNCGEPHYGNLYILDSDPNLTSFNCSNCEAVIEELVIEIRHGRIDKTHAVTKASLRGRFAIDSEIADIFIIKDDGTLETKANWNDPPLQLYNHD